MIGISICLFLSVFVIPFDERLSAQNAQRQEVDTKLQYKPAACEKGSQNSAQDLLCLFFVCHGVFGVSYASDIVRVGIDTNQSLTLRSECAQIISA